MKIITRCVMDWDGNILEEDSYEYEGPIARAKSSGSSPQPTDPYEQASAQYGLDTGTANYNAALNRTNSVNPLGSSTWNVTGYSGGAPTSSDSPGTTAYGLGGGSYSPFRGGTYSPYQSETSSEDGSGAPLYTQTTSLAPQFNAALEAPINSYNIVGDQGVGQAAGAAGQAAFNQEMGYLAPEEQQAQETQNSQLANEGAMPGSAAYDYQQQELGRQQSFQNVQAADSAVGAGQSALSNMANIGSTELQNELASRNAPIQEYEELAGGNSSPVSAATPDISNAFAQQYQGALAGYNANVATNNANTQAGAGLAAAVIGAAF